MKKQKKNKEEETNEEKDEVEEKEKDTEKDNNEDSDESKTPDTKIKKSIFYIFYEILGALCLVLLILTLFDGPKDFILDKIEIFLGIVIIIYAVLFLIPHTFKKKESKLINFLTFLELVIIIILGLLTITNKKIEQLNISRTIGLIVYIFGLVEIVRGYHSEGGVKVFKNNLLNGLIKYFNIFLITLGTYIFFDMPFDKYLLTSVRIFLIALAAISIIIGLLKMPKKKH